MTKIRSHHYIIESAAKISEKKTSFFVQCNIISTIHAQQLTQQNVCSESQGKIIRFDFRNLQTV